MTSFSLGNRPATRRNWRTAPLWLLLVGALSFPGRGGEVGELIFFDGFETFIDQTIVAGETLTLDLTVLPPQGDYGDVTYSVEPLPLPPNATLDGPTFIFAPTAEQAGAFEFMFMAENDMGDMRSGAVEITVLEPPEDGTTAISGRLLDSIALSQGDEVPIVGATVQILGGSASTTTDAQGNFHLDDIAGTEVVLDVETDTADFAPDGSGYASFRTPLSLVANVTNPIGDPILLPRIDPDGTAMVDPGSNTVVENPDLGVSIEIPAGTAENEGGGDFSGEMSISEVPADMPPMQLPRELQPGMLITIQPTGVNFTQPVPITFPNIDNLPPGFETNLWSLSETGVFTVTGRGKVSADGDRIETVSGGVWAATWHAPVPEPPEINDDTDDNNAEEDIDSPDEEAQCQVGSSASLRGGCLRIRHRLPVHQSLGTERSLELLYRSTNAYPNPIININSSLSTTTATPNAFDIELINVAGVDQDFRAVVEPLRDSQRHAFTFDASAFPTGRYPYDLMIAGQYDRSFVGARDFGNVLVNNQIQSPFGAGWQMTGISRLVDTEGDLLLQTKDGGLKRFAGDLFAPARVFPADRVPRSITSADFNGDGAIDLATANGGSDDTSVLLGNGDGSFQDQQRFAAGDAPRSITAADFNGDGVIDLATANAGFDDISILLGNGDGSFQDPLLFAAGDFPESITAADFNGDGAIDLATANNSSNDTSVLLGNGDGTFHAPDRFGAGDRPSSITAADFNGDGAVDLVTANTLSDDISVLLGNGDGSFQDQQRFAAGHGPGSITAVDFNGDGAIDLATANAGPDDTSVLLGNGDGTFQGQRRFAAGDAPVSITAADFNGDGATDLATANFGSDDTSVLLGNGDGTFQGQQRFAAGSGLYSITAANFNGDGLPDLAAVNLHANDISVLLNQPVPDVLAGPASDFTTIERQSDGAFIRFFNEGSQVHFDAEGLQTSSVDPNGNTTSFAYDGQQRLVSITDPAGKVTQLRYTGQRLSEIENPAGRITRFTHDATGNLTRITNPDESTREFSYDDHHLLTRQTDERGMVTEYTYDATGRLIMSRQPDGSERMLAASRTQALVADPESTSVDNPAPAVPAGDVESGFINGDGTIQTFESDSLGKITRRTDAAGLMTTIERDADGNPVTTTFPDGTVISATFDNRGNLTSFSDNVRGGTRTLEYQQAFNRLTRITDSQGNTTKLDYDERGNLTGLTSPTDRNLAFTHNARGLTETSTDALGTQRQFEYNEAGNLVRLTEGTSTARRTTDITYTGEGLPATLTNAEGQQSGFEYDVEGRLTRLALPDGRAIAIAYDDAGNPIAITPPGRPEHRFSFNEVNLETAYDPPAIGLSDDITRMEYNNARQLTGIVRPDGKRVEFGYDSTGRLQDRTMPAGATTLGYDADTGQLISVDTADIDLDFQWDGFLPVSASASGDIDGQVSQDFDSDFFLISEAVNGDAVSFEYDRDGLLIQAGALNLTRESASGLLGSTTLGVVSVSIDYNAFAEPRTRQIEVNDNPVLGFGFTRDKLGRIEQLTETLGGSTVALDYRYDLAGRLIEVRQNDTPIETYTYDANSNRIQSTTAAGTIDYDYDDQDRLIEATGPAGTTTYEYTDAGELEAKTAPAGTTTYNYDAAGNLREVTLPDGTVIEYLIDGLDRRVGKRVNGELVKGWLYRGLLNPVAELDAQGNVVTRFVYGERPNVPAYMIRDGKTYRIVSDHLGSPRLLIDTDTGEVVQQMAYDTFGRVIEDTNPGFQPFGFAGGLYDPDTGLVRFGARDYDPETGRWTAKDPIRFAGGDPNLYGYVLNDPVNLVDPYGLLGGPFGPLNRRGINTRTAIEVSRHSNALALAGTIAAVGGTAGTTAAARGGALVCRAVSSAAASSRGREALKTACLAASLCTIQINSAGNIVIKPTRAVLQQRRRLQKIRAGIQREQVNRFREVIRDR